MSHWLLVSERWRLSWCINPFAGSTKSFTHWVPELTHPHRLVTLSRRAGYPEIIRPNAVTALRAFGLWCTLIHLLIPALLYKSFTYLFIYLITYVFTSLRICPYLFQAGDHKRQAKPGFSFFLFFLSYIVLVFSIFCYGCTFASVVFVLVFPVLSHKIGCEERLQNDLFCVSGT